MLRKIILIFGKESEIFSSFDKDGNLISFSDDHDDLDNEVVYKSILNKNRLEDEIDNMPGNIKNRESKIEKLNQRLYTLYDKIEQLEEKIENCNAKMLSLQNEELTLENVKSLLENFNKIYDVITEQERKQLI